MNAAASQAKLKYNVDVEDQDFDVALDGYQAARATIAANPEAALEAQRRLAFAALQRIDSM